MSILKNCLKLESLSCQHIRPYVVLFSALRITIAQDFIATGVRFLQRDRLYRICHEIFFTLTVWRTCAGPLRSPPRIIQLMPFSLHCGLTGPRSRLSYVLYQCNYRLFVFDKINHDANNVRGGAYRGKFLRLRHAWHSRRCCSTNG